MLLDNKPYTFDRVVRMLLTSGILFLMIWLLSYLSDVLLPFAAAFLLAYLINPLVTAIQKRVKNRGAAVGLSLMVLLIILILAGMLLVPMIIGEFEAMNPFLEKLANSKTPAWIEQYIPSISWDEISRFAASEDLRSLFKSDKFQEIASQTARKLLPGIWNVISGATSFIFGLIGMAVVLLYMIFLLIDYEKIKETWPNYLPAPYRKGITEFVFEFNEGMRRYFRGQALIAASVGAILAVGFWLIGLPLGILLGLFIGFLNMVPYLQIIGLIPAFILAVFYGLVAGGPPWQMPLLTLLVFSIAQGTQDGFLTPKIMGKVSGLSPAVILLSLAIWGKLLGLLGLLIAIPITCLLLAYYKRVLAPQPSDLAHATSSRH